MVELMMRHHTHTHTKRKEKKKKNWVSEVLPSGVKGRGRGGGGRLAGWRERERERETEEEEEGGCVVAPRNGVWLTLTPSLLLLESLPFFVEPAPFLWAHCTRRSPRPWRLGTTDLFPPPRARLFPLNMAQSPVVPCPELPAPTRASNFVCPLCFAFDHQVLKRLIHF